MTFKLIKITAQLKPKGLKVCEVDIQQKPIIIFNPVNLYFALYFVVFSRGKKSEIDGHSFLRKKNNFSIKKSNNISSFRAIT